MMCLTCLAARMFRRTMSNSLFTSPRCRRLAILLACAALLQPGNLSGERIAVRQSEGLVHGFLLLHTLDGDHLADGDLIQVARGNRVTTQLVFHFKDGSLHDETATYSQSGSFRLLSYHLVQKGPAFKTQMDFSIDASSGQVTIRHSGDDGKEKEEVISERLKLPPDIANGIVLTLLKNIRPETPRTTVSFVAATPKPRLVKLQIAPQGEEPFTTGGAKRKATHYVVKVELGGVLRIGGAAAGQAAHRHSRLDSPGSGSGFRQVRGGALPGRPHLAYRANQSGLAQIADRGKQEVKGAPSASSPAANSASHKPGSRIRWACNKSRPAAD